MIHFKCLVYICTYITIYLSVAPDPVTNFKVSEMQDGSLLLTWVPPSVRNGEYRYIINYSFISRFNYPDHPDRTETSNDVITFTLEREDNELESGKNGYKLVNQSNDEDKRIRSFADYNFSITCVNILFGAESSTVQESISTKSQGEVILHIELYLFMYSWIL